MKGQKDYDNAKIYKLISTIDDNYYIGSTCCSLTVRLHQHKKDSKRQPDRKVYKWMNDVGIENIKIILIHNDFVCNNMDELRREEDSYIQMYKDDENCMNTHRAYQTIEERREQKRLNYESYKEFNKEALKKYSKQYREQNREVIREKGKEKITCDICNCQISRSSITAHNKSNKHQTKLKASTI